MLTPLKPISGKYFTNPYFKTKLTRINDEILAKDSVPPDKWNGLSDVEKIKRKAEGRQYSCLETFIYEGHDYFPEYEVRKTMVNYYEIDFRNSHKIKCNHKKPYDQLVESKLLQLSIETRSKFREKIARFYGRIPNEDLI